MNTLGVIALGLFLVCYALLWLYFRLHRAEQKAQALQQENQQQKAEIVAKKAEIKHASISRHNHETVTRSDASGIDEQLYTHGWFRDDYSRVGVPRVSQNLPKSGGHDGDQASDTSSQSNTSGDL